MAMDKTSAAADLAFLRGLVSGGQDRAAQRAFGRLYALWGLAFGLPLLLEWARMMGWIWLPKSYWLVVSVVVTVVLLAISVVGARRAGPTLGVQARATNAVFGGVGWANVAVLLGLGLVAFSLRDGRIMMIHALVVFAFQGAAWYAVWALRKQPWTGIVAAGWFVFAVALGATIPTPNFVLLAALGLILLMGVPGWVMSRLGAEPA